MRPSLRQAPYGPLYDGFAWDIPARLNMAVQACDDWAARAPDRVAIVDLSGEGPRDITYADLREMADRLALALVARGVVRGDRVGVLRSQGAWCAAAHIAIWKIGAISIPLFKLFKHDALQSRVGDAGARVIVTDGEGVGLLADLAQVEALVPEGCALPDGRFDTLKTDAEDPAVLIYTSGTTGAPKGALHAHRVLTGHLPGVEISHDFLGQADDCLWTPADWAWIGGLFDVLMPGLAIGVPVVAARMAKFGPEEWLQPYTVEEVARQAEAGTKKIAVCAPAFSADCIET
ncbi:MAG: ferrochelatase, partial [Roseovarius sp.]|nr:ferrochelatase [Roseovarius sp.]